MTWWNLYGFNTDSNRPLSMRLLKPKKQLPSALEAGRAQRGDTHKSRTSLRTFDIMLRLPSSALNSMSCATVPEACMFWTARTTE